MDRRGVVSISDRSQWSGTGASQSEHSRTNYPVDELSEQEFGFENSLNMDGEINISSESVETKASHVGLHIMVVDDDVICLSIVAGILKTWKYEVVTVNSARDALTTLRTRSNFFNLIVTDVHMPEMDGFEFQKLVREEFHLPVVMMSADEKESSMLRGLEDGAAFYIVKPVNYDDLKNLWQYAVAPKKGKSHVVMREIERTQGASRLEKTSDNEVESLMNEEKHNKRDSKRKTWKKANEDNGKEKSETVAPKKAKVIWTSALHNRFLEAARKIGLERAVPKRILEIMNVPGLTRENVASHLQKYRIFLKRVMETSSPGTITGKNISERTLRSSFATGHPSLVVNALQRAFPQFLDHQQVGASQSQPRLLSDLSIANGSSLSSTIFPNQQASCGNPIPQLGYVQAHSTNKHTYLQQPTFGNTTARYQANGSGMNAMNPMQMYQQKTQARSELVPNAMSNNTFTALGVSGPNNIYGIQNNGVNNSNMTLNNAGSGQMGFPGCEMLNGFNGGFSLFDGFGSTNQIPPRFSNVIQQEENPMLPPQQNNLGEGGEDNSNLLDQVRNNTAPIENSSIPQFAENDLDESFAQNQPKDPFYDEQQIGEEVHNHGYTIKSKPVEYNPSGNQQSSNERQSDGGMINYNYSSGMNQLDDYFPIFDPPYLDQQQGGEVVVHGAYNGHPELNPTWNTGVSDDIMDLVFGPSGMY